jgi:hypothetical protein
MKLMGLVKLAALVVVFYLVVFAALALMGAI